MPESVDEVIQAVWQELDRAASDAQHNWRLPVLATVDASGLPQARTVVLRESDRSARQLVIYSDQRSPKVAQINHRHNVVLVFWSRTLGWQLRVSGTGVIDCASDDAARIWQRLQGTAAAGDYLRAEAPGSRIAASLAGSHPIADATFSAAADGSGLIAAGHPATGFFCRIVIHTEEIDWLDLRADGHRRLRWRDSGAQWIVP